MGEGRCAVCGSRMRRTHSHEILGRYTGQFIRCNDCGYWTVLDPFWLEEAYEDAIASTDTGIMQRNLQVARVLGGIIEAVAPSGPYVDWAGGLGILTRLMRDRGYDYYWHDAYARNELARGFEWYTQSEAATLVTAIEVLEHVTSPLDFIHEIRAATQTPIITFSQETYDHETTPEWWYFSYETGQHVSFYTLQTLQTIAARSGMHYLNAGGLHLWSVRPLVVTVPRVRRLRNRVSARLDPPSARRSLTWEDHETMTWRLNSGGQAL